MTTYTTVQISNMALAHIGVGNFITSLSTDTSAEADAINAFLEISREETLRDFPWPFATKTADSTDTATGSTTAFGLIAEDPNDEWAFSYRYPTDCVEIRRIQSGLRQDTVVSRVPYRVGYDGTTTTATGRLIFTDMEDAVLEYTALVTDTSIYPPDFVMAWSYRLAWHIAPRLANNHSPQMTQNLMQLYSLHIAKAKLNSGNEEQPDRPSDAEWISGR